MKNKINELGYWIVSGFLLALIPVAAFAIGAGFVYFLAIIAG